MKKNLLYLLITIQFTVFAQNYTVTPIPHQVYTVSLPVQYTTDDTYSSVINLPFNFNFYGNTYNQVVVSTNGYIDFRSELAGAFSPWSFNLTIPNVSFPAKNSILGCFHDLNNSVSGGSINYSVVGAAPYQKFVVFFNNNAHFSCNTTKSSFQMVLYETLNIIDVQLIDKPVCTNWNGGRAVTGIINLDGSQALTPPNRNTGQWTAYHEGWRFNPNTYSVGAYHYIKCATSSTGMETFDLNLIRNDISSANPTLIQFFETLQDAQLFQNAIATNTYETSTFPHVIYASGNGVITTINLNKVDCNQDFDLDTIVSSLEDLNNDGNLGNDDTDNDGIPNFIDNDDDGDIILTNVEYVFTNRNGSFNLIDTDNDGITNYLDNDDDGDGVLTINEDYNYNNDPTDDDTNNNGTPDYLEFAVALSSEAQEIDFYAIYPNPAKEFIQLSFTDTYQSISYKIINLQGQVVTEEKQIHNDGLKHTINTAKLTKGTYLLSVTADNRNANKLIIIE